MKKILIGLIALFLVFSFSLSTASKAEAYSSRVSGYYRSSGTYVQPYYRTNSNSTRYDNYSYKGNYNPYTGKTGTKW